jgi:hypothetical protein
MEDIKSPIIVAWLACLLAMQVVEPFQIMDMLNDLFSRLDALTDVHGVHKVRCD